MHRPAISSRSVDAFIFDLDGVLIHSTGAHADAFRTILNRYDILDAPYAKIAGMRTKDALVQVFAVYRVGISQEELDKLVIEKREIAFRSLQEKLNIDPDCNLVLKELSSRFALGLATSASRRVLELFLERSKTRHLFQATVCEDMVHHAKPHPEIFLRCASDLQLPASQCIVVEDSLSGIESALSAGMRVIARSGTFDSLPPDPRVLGLIDSLPQMLSWQ